MSQMSGEEGEGRRRDYSNFETVMLNEEFLEVTEIIMENTFFNIVQETTRKEGDLMRISKTFLTPNI